MKSLLTCVKISSLSFIHFQASLSMTYFFFFFFNDTATTEIYTLSLHDALPIFERDAVGAMREAAVPLPVPRHVGLAVLSEDRKSTRLNSSHSQISYAVFCLKKKKKTSQRDDRRPIERNLHVASESAYERCYASL